MTKLLIELFLPGIEAVVERYRVLYEQECAHVTKMIKETRDVHTSLPNNYWHKSHELRGRWIMAGQLRDSYKELLLEELLELNKERRGKNR